VKAKSVVPSNSLNPFNELKSSFLFLSFDLYKEILEYCPKATRIFLSSSSPDLIYSPTGFSMRTVAFLWDDPSLEHNSMLTYLQKGGSDELLLLDAFEDSFFIT